MRSPWFRAFVLGGGIALTACGGDSDAPERATPTVTTATPLPSPTFTAPAGARFDETGNIVRDNPGLRPGTWFLVYERPGAPAVNAALALAAASLCTAQGKPLPCGSLQPGTRARVVGVETGGTVHVESLVVLD
jgi:hypothetical protein